MKIGIFYKTEKKEIIYQITKLAEENGFILDNDNPDVVFTLGGDGTFLRAIHRYIDKLDNVLFVGINSGSLGFFYDFKKEDIPLVFELLKHKTYLLKEHSLIKGVATYEKQEETIFAVNEIRVENPFHTLICDVAINDEALETYRGNGLLVSSSLGSSAYNKSLGGALLDNDLEALELTEIAGLGNNLYRSLGSSIILKGDKQIIITGQLSDAVIGFDFSNIRKEDKLLKLAISYSNKKFRVIHSPNYSYIDKIRKSFILWW